jgi:hypothetical protein
VFRKFFILSTLIFAFYLQTVGQIIQQEIRPNILRIVHKLNKENTLHLGGPVGFSAKLETNNKYYKLYKKLSKKAKDEELLLLTNNNSKIVVLYSFIILYSRNYKKLKDVFLQHIADTSEVWVAGGCTGGIARINFFMLMQFNPAYMDSQQPYLKQEEYDKYKKEIGMNN